MKKRNGFVSNSSSSSFILGYKGDLASNLAQAFKVPEDHPFHGMSDPIVKAFLNEVKSCTKWASIEDYLEFCKENYDDPKPEVINLLTKGFTVTTEGYFSNDSGDSIEGFLCDSDIEYSSDNLVISKEGGY